jgi:hypothetical protein
MKWIAVAALLLAPVSAAHAAEPAMDYSWKGIVACKTLADSPAFKFSNFPPEAKRVRIFLTEGKRELGGQEVELPASGIVAFGAARTFSPCNPGYYRWTAVFKSATGQILGQAQQSRFYPTDEILPEK